MHGEINSCRTIVNLKGRHNLGDLNIDGRIILDLIVVGHCPLYEVY
jgi:hypothetical protein